MHYLPAPCFSAHFQFPLSTSKSKQALNPNELDQVEAGITARLNEAGTNTDNKEYVVFPHSGYVDVQTRTVNPNRPGFDFQENRAIDIIHPGGPFNPNGKVWKSDDED